MRSHSPEPVGLPPPVYSNVAPTVTSHPAPPLNLPVEVDEDAERRDSVDFLTRSQTGLDQRLKSMVAQRMFGGVLKECGGASPDADEKPYSPASDQPDISISNTGTPKPEEDDADSIPTPDSGNVTPDDGASPHINMNNPILQALYSSSPDQNKKNEEQTESVSEATTLKLQSEMQVMTNTVADIDTEYLQGILNTVKSSSTAPKEEALLSSPASSAIAVTPQKQADLAAIKDIKITPTVTNLLGELFPQLSKTLQQNRKRKQDSCEEEMSAQKTRKMDDGHNLPPGMLPSEHLPPHSQQPGSHVMSGPPRPNIGPPPPISGPPRPNIGLPRPNSGPPHPISRPPRPNLGPPRPDHGPPATVSGQPRPNLGPPRPDHGPPATVSGQPRPNLGPPRPNSGPPPPVSGPPHPSLRSPHPRPTSAPMPRGMSPPVRGQYYPASPTESPRSPFPPRYRGPPPSFMRPPPPRGAPLTMRHPGPPPSERMGLRPRAPYPRPPSSGSAMVPNHTGPVPPGAYPPQSREQYKHMNVTGPRRTSGEVDPYRVPPQPQPPYQGASSFRPPRYV